ncbi:MAG: PEP/pyruvate-binding domain-containing protein [Desulfurivibrionaceae bacterium]|jgi:pyruvate,water dikinase
MALRDLLKGFSIPHWFTPKACRPLPLIFAQFREVLKANNQALELIADMGEKLSGEYLFDLRYVEATVEEMIAAMRRALAAINILTQNQCVALHEVFTPMEARVRAILNKRDDREGPSLLWLTEVETRHWPLVGGKAAHLSELLHNPKVRVPEGFVITTRLFHDLLDLNGIRPEFDRFELLISEHLPDEEEIEALRCLLQDKVFRAEPPSGFLDTLTESLLRLTATNELPLFLAVRSSAQEEDMDFSFAGQFHTELQVPPQAEAVYRAYLQVAASLFGAKAILYRRQVFPEGSPMSIAACCQRMIRAQASGIIYSIDPMEPGSQSMVAVGALGQGQAVVEGQVPTDFFRLSKEEPPQVIERVIAAKHEALRSTGEADGGLAMQAVPNGQVEAPCLDEPILFELAGIAIHLETFFKRPQDIEWTLDPQGTLYILQSRPLLITESERGKPRLSEKLEGYELVAVDVGRVAQQGIGAGPAFWVETLADLKDFPEGAVLISHRDSSQFVQVMQRAAAIVTEVGTPASHMATLCREFRVPCLVGVPDIMAKVAPGEEITVDAEDRRIYRGRVVELLTYQATTTMDLHMAPEFRMLRRILREVSRLNLVDPLMQDFRPEGCKTFHDVLRFIHETAVLHLVELGRDDRCLPGGLARRLDLPIQAGILAIDIGGGIAPDAPPDQIPFSAIRSIPFRAILQGMLFPGAWHQETMSVSFRDMMHSMMTTPQDTLSGQYTGHNIAIISETYVNLCFRFGYHFNIIDAFCHDVERDNHIYFRFLGGATDIAKRSRRATLIATILEAFDFSIQTKGDLVIARTSNLSQPEMERTLDILGRLIGFTRQLDVQMTDDQAVARYAEAFLMGDYGIVAGN